MKNRMDELHAKYPDLSKVADRDLDGLVVEYLFGWKEKEIGPDAFGKDASVILMDPALAEDFRFPPKGKVHRSYLAPAFSTSLNQAIDLAKMYGYRQVSITGPYHTLARRITEAILTGKSPTQI